MTTATAPRRTSWLARLIGKGRERDRLLPLYEAVVAVGRRPFWYRDGKVPDTVDGRFDMIAAVTAIVLLHMERLEDEQAKTDSVLLTELFIADMDESLRQIGIGDYVVGKHVGRMVGALGGRLHAFREAILTGDFTGAVHRNIFHEAESSDASVRIVADGLARFHVALGDYTRTELAAGRLPDA